MTPSDPPAPHVLVVEEPHEPEAGVARMLDEIQYPYRMAEGMLDAVKALQSTPFDCVLVRLPQGDIAPRTVVEELRRVDRSLPVVFVCDATEAPSMMDVIGTDRVTVLQAPPDPSRVESAIQRVVSRRRVDTELERYSVLKTSILRVLFDLVDASGEEELYRVFSDWWLDSELYSVVLFGAYDAGSTELILRWPFSGRFTGAEIAAIVGSDERDLLERAASNHEVVVTRGRSVSRGAASADTLVEEGSSSPDRQDRAGEQSLAMVPVYWDETLYYVLGLVTDAEIDTAEQELLDHTGRMVGKLLWMNDRIKAPSDDSTARAAGIVDRFASEIQDPLLTAITRLEDILAENESDELEPVYETVQQIAELPEMFTELVHTEGVTETHMRDFAETASAAWEAIDHPNAELFITDSRLLAADHDLLEHMFRDVFTNALRLGGPDTTIRIGVFEDGFYVEDDGPGIGSTDENEVFAWSGQQPGGGLGFVAEVVRAHDWRVSVTESTLGGARFEVSGIAWPVDKPGSGEKDLSGS